MPDKVIEIPRVGAVAFPDTMSDQDIAAAAAKLHAEATQQPPSPSLLDRAIDALPEAGGLVGGVVGGIGGTAFGAGVGGVPGALGGATVGGGAGEALRQLLTRARGGAAPTSMSEAVASIAKEGAIQGGMEAAGGVLMKGARMAGRGLMDFALRPSQTILKEFPDVVDRVLEHRLPVGRLLPGMQSGSEQAAQKLVGSSRALRALLDRAQASGKTFESSQVAEPVLELIDEIAKEPLPEASMRQLDGMISEFLRNHRGPLTPNAVKDLKQSAQAIARPIYRAEANNSYVPAAETLRARFNEKIATGAKSSLEQIPGVKEREATTQGLIGATAAIRQAERRRLPLAAETTSAAVGAVAGALRSQGYELAGDLPADVARATAGWLITRSLMSPKVTSRGALALTNRQVQQLLRQVPRLADYVVRAPEAGAESPMPDTGDRRAEGDRQP